MRAGTSRESSGAERGGEGVVGRSMVTEVVAEVAAESKGGNRLAAGKGSCGGRQCGSLSRGA